MTSVSKTRAQARFAAIEKSQKNALNEREEKALKISENTARLKALRLAKAAEDNAKPAIKKATPRKRATK
ncbi:transcriptional regulator [Cohaesibacter celericrescens]|uniref:Transcriptional regulator n=1 Tax=Cohaesibacter celericrescens TaxID=2067669 RepID=A0A2N5XQV6_9HYPH|nr:transcriptional regulator [Cohaesibacter celericrescens]PLW76889.1 transcriptional regulator [Cohaesibacter celericrescens]